MSRESVTINRIPQKTYRWLHMNESSMDVFEGDVVAGQEEIPDECVVWTKPYASSGIETGMGSGFDTVFLNSKAVQKCISVPDEKKLDEPLRFSFSLDSHDGVSSIYLEVGNGARCTLILFIDSEHESFGRFASQIQIVMGKRARLKLVEVVRAPGRDVFCDIGVKQDEDDAEFELVQLFLDGGHIFAGCRSKLSGTRASMKTDIAYQVSGENHLDMNYVADHYGSRTLSEINVSGVLRDKAKKLFRGTIDFKKGAKGAVGNEKEDVLLIDDGVHNQSIPLILCAEEDVEGNHGATIGKLAEDIMFYLQSRGLATEEIYEMLAKARIDAVCSLIQDPKTEERVG